MFVVPDQTDIGKIHVLAIGPCDTSYEGGFFHFLITCSHEYPFQPPSVTLLTAHTNIVMFHPKFSASGQLFLARKIYWTSAMSLSDIQTDLHTAMTEPACSAASCRETHTHTHLPHILQHETLRLAVVGSLGTWEDYTAPPYSDFLQTVRDSFPDFYDHYSEICERNRYRDGERFHPEQFFNLESYKKTWNF